MRQVREARLVQELARLSPGDLGMVMALVSKLRNGSGAPDLIRLNSTE